jgi:RNA polymerase sigma-70 factor (ECF subfamily)
VADDAGIARFEDWYRQEHARLVTLVSAAVGDAEIGREAADEALARAFERWNRVSSMGSPSGWAYQVALNVARRRARRRAMERRLLGRHRAESVPGPTGELWALVSVLSRRQRQAVLLRHVGQLTESEVADVMGVARGTVSTTLRAAYRTLGVALRDTDETNDDENYDEQELEHERSR